MKFLPPLAPGAREDMLARKEQRLIFVFGGILLCSVFLFVLFICPCYARLVRPDVSGCRRYREEPTVIGPLPMSRQPSRMSHDIPDGHMKGKIAPRARK